MITLTREEAQQVLDALEEAQNYTSCETWSPSMTEGLRKQEETLRAKLAQPEPKPSAWAVQEGVNLHDVFLFKDEADEMCHLKGDHAKAIPLYTARLAQPEPEPVAKMKELLEVQGRDGNWNLDQYMQGMYNGMELMVALAEGRDPAFRKAPENWLSAPPQRVYCSCGDGIVPEDGALCGTCVSLKKMREWQGLTDEEKSEIYNRNYNLYAHDMHIGDFFLIQQAVEAKLKEKNI